MSITKTISKIAGWPSASIGPTTAQTYSLNFNINDANIWPDGVPSNASMMVDFHILYDHGNSNYTTSGIIRGRFNITNQMSDLDSQIKLGNSLVIDAVLTTPSVNFIGIDVTISLSRVGGHLSVRPVIQLVQVHS